MRDEFLVGVIKALASRVAERCSNPACRRPTCGPTGDPEGSINIGVAAHIEAAAPGGPRFNSAMPRKKRSSGANGIWLCQSCAKLIDSDVGQFSVERLVDWKQRAEASASLALSAPSQFRQIAPSELHTEHSVAYQVVLKALEEELGCPIVTDIKIPTVDGWLYLDGAVVRKEDLVAIEIRECRDHGIPYFQIEHLIELGTKLVFPRFEGFVLYIAAVSDRDATIDQEVHSRLLSLASGAPFEVFIRMYRVNSLRAKFSI